MVNSFLKLKPLRSKEFMAFAHSTKPALCCVCRERYFSHLHHFGNDGGMGMKPSDYMVARLCVECHRAYDMKYNVLLRGGHADQLISMQMDALELHDMWFRHLEDNRNKKLMLRCRSCNHCDGGCCNAKLRHVEPPSDCALDALVEKLIEFCPNNVDEAKKWFIEWSNVRSSNVLGFSLESFSEILEASDVREMKFIASQAMKVAGVRGVEK